MRRVCIFYCTVGDDVLALCLFGEVDDLFLCCVEQVCA